MATHSAPISPAPLPWPGDDPDLVPFLPMVYVAWADGILDAGEMEAISERVEERAELPQESFAVLRSWLRPERPPTPVELAGLRDRVRELAGRITAEERRSLSSLGVAIARKAKGARERWATDRGLRTLAAVEEVLGVLGDEAARALLEGDGRRPVPSPPPTPEPPCEVAGLRRLLDGERAELRAEVLELLHDPLFRTPQEIDTASHRARTSRAIRVLAERGYGMQGLPGALGGGEDIPGSILVFETLALGDLSVLVKFGVQFGLFGGSVLQLGTERHHRRWLPAIGTLDLPGCYAMTEVDHGSNVRELETTARYLPGEGEFEIHTPHPGARKDWIGNAADDGRMATVFAQLEVDGEGHGVHAFLVPIRDEEGRPLPGVAIEDCGVKVGLNGVDNGRIGFDRVRVPRDNLLDRFARVSEDGAYESSINSAGRRFFTMLGTLVTGRISIAAASVSVSKTALAIALPYSAERRQFGPAGEPEVPVLDYLTQQRLLLPRLAEAYALHFAVRRLVADYARSRSPEDRVRVEAVAAGLKAYASSHALDTIQAARESMGGRGYLAAHRLGQLRSDADVFTTFEGANVVLLQLVARGLLARYREDLGALDFRGMLRMLAERAGAEATRRNPVRSRRSGEGFLRDPETHLDAFRFREQRLLGTAARRLKARIDEGMDSFEAMNECQDHLVALAEAHVERWILERFQEGIARAEDSAAEEVLGTLAALWALSRIEEDRAWFLESGYMESGQSRGVREQVNRLCRELRDAALPLVEGFGIPEEILEAPAGLAE